MMTGKAVAVGVSDLDRITIELRGLICQEIN